MYSVRRTLMFLLIVTVVGSLFTYKIVQKAYDSYDDGSASLDVQLASQKS